MKLKKNVLKVVVSLLLVLSMIVSPFFNIKAQADIKAGMENTDVTYAKIATGNTSAAGNKFIGNGFEAELKVTSRWEGAFNANVILTNTSNETIENWALQFVMPHEITNIWNGVISKIENGNYTVKNAGFNQDVKPGKTVSFGFTAKAAGELVLPSEYNLACFEEIVLQDAYEISFKVTSDWKSAFNGEIRIKNVSQKTIEDWKLEFDFELTIERFWTAEIISHTGNHYRIKNADYNSNIKPGETIILGFRGNPGNVNIMPSNYILTEIVLEPSTVDIQKDSDNDGLIDILEEYFGTNINNHDTDNDGLSDYIEYILELNPLTKDTDGNGIEDGFEDTDGDGLNNLDEIKAGSDCSEQDTDGDGLLDGEEVNVYKTLPTKVDTDEDTIADGDEILLGLNPLEAYSDGITHDSNRKFEQVLSEDSIEDILKDSSNLLIPHISGLVSNVIDKKVYIKQFDSYTLQENRAIVGEPINIEISYDSEADLTLRFNYSNFLEYYTEKELNTLAICQYANDDFAPLETKIDKSNHTLNADISGGGIYFVINAEEFLNNLGINPLRELKTEDTYLYSITEEETIKYEENDDPDANYVPEEWYDEYYIDDNTEDDFDITESETIKRSMLNESALESAKGQADITFIIDTTGSMYGAITNVRSNISQFVDRLTTEYNVQVNFALVDYKDITVDGLYSTKLIKNGPSNWFSNVEAYKDSISRLYISGGGDGPETAIDGLAMAHNLDYRSNVNKFVILVTDANYKINNLYGIGSMAEMANMLQEKNINTSVIAPTYYKSQYAVLFETTDGIFADIYGNFSNELIKLADKIGETVNDGSWVLLSDYQYIKLKDEVAPTNGVDTDGDGVSDYIELGTKVIRDLSHFIKLVLDAYGIPEEYYNGKRNIEVYKYLSNPILVDTDFDGLNDNDSRDLIKRNYGSIDDSSDNFSGKLSGYNSGNLNGNSFSGSLIANFKDDINVDFTVDYSYFFTKRNTSYHKDLSVLASVYAAAAYNGKFDVTNGAKGSGKIKDIFELFGLDDIESYELASDFSDDDISQIHIGHRVVEYKGKKKDIIVVSVRGTNKTLEEWSSNFDIGADTNGYWDADNLYWRNKGNHKGFDVAANRIYDYILNYVKENVGTVAQKVIYITGHSRGAAISNILGSLFENKKDYESYVYTFASPNTTTMTNVHSYKTIFNVVNSDDIITQLPLSSWGFKKYGQTAPYTISIAKYYEDSKFFTNKIGTYEWLLGEDYNNDGGMERTLKLFGNIAGDADDLYEYDMTSDGLVNPHNKYHTTLNGAEEELVKVNRELENQKLDRFSYAYVDDAAIKRVLVRYKPAYLMQILANMSCSHGPLLGYDVKGKYVAAKASFAASSGEIKPVGGMKSPHYAESYYLIARNNFKPLP